MRRERGAVLITLLMVTIVVAMFLGALLLRSHSSLTDSTHYRDGIKAEQAARAGVNHLMSLLESDPTWVQNLQATWSGATYTVTFDTSQAVFSVNNLTSDLPATDLSVQGHQVAPRSADIVVVGSCGLAKRTFRVVVQRGFSSMRAVSAIGRIELSGDVEVDGVKSLLPEPGKSDPEPAPGGLLSKHRSSSPAQPSISWTGGSSFLLGDLSELETAAPESGGEAVSANLRSLFPDQIADNSAADTIPEIDVSAKVTAGMGEPAVAPSGAILTENLYLQAPGSVSGDLTVTGDIILTQGTLYIDGNLNLNGGVKGQGTIYVSGDVSMVGGNTVVQAGEPSGVAMLVGGDASFQGIDATGYLDFLAASDPAIQTAYDDTVVRLNNYSANSSGDYWWTSVELAKHVGGSSGPGERVWVNPIPSPDGRHILGYENGCLPALTLAIKDTGLHLTDPRAKKVVSALEEMQYHFRDNSISTTVDLTGRELDDDYQIVEGGVTLDRIQAEALKLGSPWDDQNLPVKYRTYSALKFVSGLNPAEWQALARARKAAYLEHNPLDFSFLGDSNFQGLVYVRGDVDASQGFQIIGGLATLGDVSLTGGCKLIFNEEYRDLLGPDVPIGIVHFEEI
jgi:hypothetical protein